VTPDQTAETAHSTLTYKIIGQILALLLLLKTLASPDGTTSCFMHCGDCNVAASQRCRHKHTDSSYSGFVVSIFSNSVCIDAVAARPSLSCRGPAVHSTYTPMRLHQARRPAYCGDSHKEGKGALQQRFLDNPQVQHDRPNLQPSPCTMTGDSLVNDQYHTQHARWISHGVALPT